MDKERPASAQRAAGAEPASPATATFIAAMFGFTIGLRVWHFVKYLFR
jgi:hypothetical protein